VSFVGLRSGSAGVACCVPVGFGELRLGRRGFVWHLRIGTFSLGKLR